jgi:hypothetical protein
MAVRLIMQVTRGEDNRLTGTVRVADGVDARDFSGTLELMRVFEELVPSAQGADVMDVDSGRPEPGSSEPTSR